MDQDLFKMMKKGLIIKLQNGKWLELVFLLFIVQI